jgi:hypothetical protein
MNKFSSLEEQWIARRLESVARYEGLFEKTKQELDSLSENINVDVYKRVQCVVNKLEVVEEDIERKNKDLRIDMNELQQAKNVIEEFKEASSRFLGNVDTSRSKGTVKVQSPTKTEAVPSETGPPLSALGSSNPISFMSSMATTAANRNIETVDKYKQRKHKDTNFSGLSDRPAKQQRFA